METRIRGIIAGDDKPSDVTIRDGKVLAITAATRGRASLGSRTSIIGPALFDIQVNGIAGLDLQNPALTPEDVRAVTDVLARSGVSHWVPTLITAPFAAIEKGCRAIAEGMRGKTAARAVRGIHIEGPHISPEDGPRGAHARKYVRKPDIRAFDRLLKAADGRILYTTVAPELDGIIPYIKAVVRRGVTVSLGHHNASPDQIAKAVDAGARLCTHLGNGLASTIDRHTNPLWPQLADDRLAASFIPDLEHLPASALKTFVRAKRPENVILASDCIHITGLKPGKYSLGDAAVELMPSGRVCLCGTDLLAGSSLGLLQGVVNAVQAAGMTFAQAFASATSIPAKLLGVKHRFDSPRIGRKADLVVFDVDVRGKAKVQGVFVNGERRT